MNTHYILTVPRLGLFRAADGLHVSDRAVGVDNELHDDGTFDLVVDGIVGIAQGMIEVLQPGMVATGVRGLDFDFGVGPIAGGVLGGGAQDGE